MMFVPITWRDLVRRIAEDNAGPLITVTCWIVALSIIWIVNN